MTKRYDPVILEHYAAQAREHGMESTSTMLDTTVRRRETELIQRFVDLATGALHREGSNNRQITICDVGCGNGSTLAILAEQHPDSNFQGIEFTPSLLKLAQKRHHEVANVRIAPGDIRDLQEYDNQFDIVLCQRVLINLLEHVDQKMGLNRLAQIIRPGGFLLSIEAFETPLTNLNAAREEFGYPAIPQAHHNLYLPDDFYSSEPCLLSLSGPQLEPGLPEDFLPSNFLSNHYFVTRVLHTLALGPEGRFARNSHFVLFLTEALDRPIGDYAPIKAHAFRKETT